MKGRLKPSSKPDHGDAKGTRKEGKEGRNERIQRIGVTLLSALQASAEACVQQRVLRFKSQQRGTHLSGRARVYTAAKRCIFAVMSENSTLSITVRYRLRCSYCAISLSFGLTTCLDRFLSFPLLASVFVPFPLFPCSSTSLSPS